MKKTKINTSPRNLGNKTTKQNLKKGKVNTKSAKQKITKKELLAPIESKPNFNASVKDNKSKTSTYKYKLFSLFNNYQIRLKIFANRTRRKFNCFKNDSEPIIKEKTKNIKIKRKEIVNKTNNFVNNVIDRINTIINKNANVKK